MVDVVNTDISPIGGDVFKNIDSKKEVFNA
jgi:hypothetical protein